MTQDEATKLIKNINIPWWKRLLPVVEWCSHLKYLSIRFTREVYRVKPITKRFILDIVYLDGKKWYQFPIRGIQIWL